MIRPAGPSNFAQKEVIRICAAGAKSRHACRNGAALQPRTCSHAPSIDRMTPNRQARGIGKKRLKTAMTYRLLDGIRVIESSAFIAAPMGGLTLAQYGADVIRVEMIGGGIDYLRWPVAPSGRSIYWTGLNKGKRSIAIDLRRPQG